MKVSSLRLALLLSVLVQFVMAGNQATPKSIAAPAAPSRPKAPEVAKMPVPVKTLYDLEIIEPDLKQDLEVFVRPGAEMKMRVSTSQGRIMNPKDFFNKLTKLRVRCSDTSGGRVEYAKVLFNVVDEKMDAEKEATKEVPGVFYIQVTLPEIPMEIIENSLNCKVIAKFNDFKYSSKLQRRAGNLAESQIFSYAAQETQQEEIYVDASLPRTRKRKKQDIEDDIEPAQDLKRRKYVSAMNRFKTGCIGVACLALVLNAGNVQNNYKTHNLVSNVNGNSAAPILPYTFMNPIVPKFQQLMPKVDRGVAGAVYGSKYGKAALSKISKSDIFTIGTLNGHKIVSLPNIVTKLTNRHTFETDSLSVSRAIIEVNDPAFSSKKGGYPSLSQTPLIGFEEDLRQIDLNSYLKQFKIIKPKNGDKLFLKGRMYRNGTIVGFHVVEFAGNAVSGIDGDDFSQNANSYLFCRQALPEHSVVGSADTQYDVGNCIVF